MIEIMKIQAYAKVTKQPEVKPEVASEQVPRGEREIGGRSELCVAWARKKTGEPVDFVLMRPSHDIRSYDLIV